jgi:hypothetical protein
MSKRLCEARYARQRAALWSAFSRIIGTATLNAAGIPTDFQN